MRGTSGARILREQIIALGGKYYVIETKIKKLLPVQCFLLRLREADVCGR